MFQKDKEKCRTFPQTLSPTTELNFLVTFLVLSCSGYHEERLSQEKEGAVLRVLICTHDVPDDNAKMKLLFQSTSALKFMNIQP